jgi:Na+-transporting methylmalonyl-CoA/oxaloacetate decarboxylase gamma subunit
MAHRLQGKQPTLAARPTAYDKEIPMKLTRVILLALAFAIPTMSTTVASAEDAPAAAGEEKPAKGKKGKKAKKAEKKEDKAEAAK